MVTHCKNKYLFFYCLLAVVLIAASCNRQDKHIDSESATNLLTETLEHCGETIYVALYHLEPDEFYSEPGSLIGQPVHSFHNFLSDPLKIEIIVRLGEKLSGSLNESNSDNFHQLIIQWCYAEQQFQEISDGKSMEEVISLAFESGLFNDAFQQLPDRFHKLEQELGPLDAAATLSSAELNQLYAFLITEFARNDSIQMNTQQEFKLSN